MSRLTAIAAAVLLFVVFLVTRAPARLLTHFVSPDRLVLQGLEGTIWEGVANRALLVTDTGYLHLGRVTWDLHPFSLLLFSPSLDIDAEWGAQHLSGGVSLRGEGNLGLEDFEAKGSAELLQQVLPAEFKGQLSLQVEELLLADWLPVRASGRMVWQNAVWMPVQGPMPLGSYAVDFSQAAGDPLVGEVVTLQGPLLAEGNVTLIGDAYELDVTLSGERPLDAALQQALELFARPVNGTYRVQLQNQLPRPSGSGDARG